MKLLTSQTPRQRPAPVEKTAQGIGHTDVGMPSSSPHVATRHTETMKMGWGIRYRIDSRLHRAEVAPSWCFDKPDK
jgi:hypothetical protein